MYLSYPSSLWEYKMGHTVHRCEYEYSRLLKTVFSTRICDRQRKMKITLSLLLCSLLVATKSNATFIEVSSVKFGEDTGDSRFTITDSQVPTTSY
jgi:hypothetical protein